MAPGPYTVADIDRREAEWHVEPFPTDNVIADLRQMMEDDPTLFTGVRGARALRALGLAEQLNARPETKRDSLGQIQNVFENLRMAIEDRHAAAPPPIERLRLGAVQRIMREEAGEPENPAPAGGRRRRTRRTRRGRKSRRKSLRQRK